MTTYWCASCRKETFQDAVAHELHMMNHKLEITNGHLSMLDDKIGTFLEMLTKIGIKMSEEQRRALK